MISNVWYYHAYARSPLEPREWRPYFLSQGFYQNGVQCSVISASYHHQQLKQYEQDQDLVLKEVDHCQFVWLKTPKYNGNGWSRIRNMFGFAYQAWKHDLVEHGLEKPELIIISSAHPLHLLAGFRWARKYRCKLAFEVRDIWPLTLNKILGVSVYHPFYQLIGLFEKMGYRYSDLVISLLPYSEEYMKGRGLRDNRFLYVPNGMPILPHADQTPLADDLQVIRNQYRRVFMYTGSMGEPNAMEPLIDVANELKDKSDIAFVMVGDGKKKAELMERNISPHCYFFEPISQQDVQATLSYADFGIISWHDSELYEYGISANKLFDYMLAKLPILQVASFTKSPVAESGCGLHIKPGPGEQLAQVFWDSSQWSDDVINQMGEKGYQYLLDNHDYQKLASRIVNYFEG